MRWPIGLERLAMPVLAQKHEQPPNGLRPSGNPAWPDEYVCPPNQPGRSERLTVAAGAGDEISRRADEARRAG
jgi:hypothetical protein